MSKHTPGPWHVVTNWQGYPYQIRASFASEGKPGGIVDITRWASISLPSSAEGAANAALIAAAPDMLAALKEARHALRWVLNTLQMAVSDHSAAQVALLDVETAIAKAKGG